MEKDYPPGEQYPLTKPTDGAYPPAYPPNYQSTDKYPASASYPAAYPTQPQPPPYDPGAVQQQQANTVVVPTAPYMQLATSVKPPNYLALSLINLLCCCWPLGIVGLIYSLRVDSEFNAGRYEEAKRASDSAKSINYIGIGIGTFLIIGYIIIAIVSNVVIIATNDS